jgi:pyruvate-formate lyase-activating enzyme
MSEKEEKGRTRRIPFITLSELKPRAWITLSGCNFKCKGCFSIARETVGEPMTVEQVINLVKTAQSGLKREKRPLRDLSTDLLVKIWEEAF